MRRCSPGSEVNTSSPLFFATHLDLLGRLVRLGRRRVRRDGQNSEIARALSTTTHVHNAVTSTTTNKRMRRCRPSRRSWKSV